MRPIVNFVMSTYWHSEIFYAIIKYFKKYGIHFKYVVTRMPISNASLYMYFRPHLAEKLCHPYVVVAHHDFEDSDTSLNFDKVRTIYLNADLIISLNSNQKIFLEQNGVKNIHIIPHGYKNFLLNTKKKHSSFKWIGFFSAFYPRGVKGEELFIEIIKNLDAEKIGVILLGNNRRFLAKSILDLGYRVKCYEKIFYPMIKHLYAKISVLLISSASEGGPASLPEAIATGTPVFIKKNIGMECDLHSNRLLYNLTGDVKIDANLVTKQCFDNNVPKDLSGIISWQECIKTYEECFLRVYKPDMKANKFLLIYYGLSYFFKLFVNKKMITHLFNKILNTLRLIGGRLYEVG